MTEHARFLGVAWYDPLHVESMADLAERDRARLRGLIGQRLQQVRALWDVADDEWFTDGPIALDFGDAGVLEVAAFKVHLCLSWDSIDFADRPEWYGDASLVLEWRTGVLGAARELLDRPLTRFRLIEYGGGLNGLGLGAGDRYVEIINALDELGLRTEPDPDAGVTYAAP